MTNQVFRLRLCYRLGAVVDGFMVIPMLSPRIGALLFGMPGFHPGPEYRYAMGLGASLMAGWTVLLLWADRRPAERKSILLITLFPVLTGLTAACIYAVSQGLVPIHRMAPTFLLQSALFLLYGTTCFRSKEIE